MTNGWRTELKTNCILKGVLYIGLLFVARISSAFRFGDLFVSAPPCAMYIELFCLRVCYTRALYVGHLDTLCIYTAAISFYVDKWLNANKIFINKSLHLPDNG